MAIDLTALRAKLAAQKAVAASPQQSTQSQQGIAKNEFPIQGSTEITQVSSSPVPSISNGNGSSLVTVPPTESSSPSASLTQVTPVAQAVEVTAPAILGTSKTTEIDHLDFLSKMNSLASAIHTQHPTMSVLLMQIHKQLRADPELVTTLDDAAIGIIVRGLQVHTKTELVAAAVAPGKKKKVTLSTDMF